MDIYSPSNEYLRCFVFLKITYLIPIQADS